MKLGNSTTKGIVLAALLWAGPLCFAQGTSKTASADVLVACDDPTAIVSPAKVDLRALKAQFEAFQDLLNRNIQETFGQGQPFSLLQDAQGIYLPGYGVAFHLEVNLHPLRLLSPFDMHPYTAAELQKARQAKLERIRQLKTELSKLLLEHGASLSAMAPEQHIAIVVHLFNMPSESRDLPTQLVMSTNRRKLLEDQSRHLTAAQFQKTSSFLEF